jgi:uncharacterized protein with PQ loop repeat
MNNVSRPSGSGARGEHAQQIAIIIVTTIFFIQLFLVIRKKYTRAVSCASFFDYNSAALKHSVVRIVPFSLPILIAPIY